jgi:hypothetical protein
MLMQIGVSSYGLIGRPLEESLAILFGIAHLIEVMDKGLHFITDPAVFESYSQDSVIHAPYHGMIIATISTCGPRKNGDRHRISSLRLFAKENCMSTFGHGSPHIVSFESSVRLSCA